MSLSATKLREHLYETLDTVLETGAPVEIIRHGRRLLIVADSPPSRTARLEPNETVKGDPGDLVDLAWDGSRPGSSP